MTIVKGIFRLFPIGEGKSVCPLASSIVLVRLYLFGSRT
jgi:hypothetical protein